MTDDGGSTRAPIAGWYVDPRAPAQLRWWDGVRWTEHTRPPVEEAVAPEPTVAQPDVPQAAVPGSTAGPPLSRRAARRLEGATTTESARVETPAVRSEEAPSANSLPFPLRPTPRETIEPSVPGPVYTTAAWALATSIAWILGVVALLAVWISTLDATVTSTWAPLASVAIPLAWFVVLLVLAIVDREKLSRAGFVRTASFLWILLGPHIYLLVRGYRTHLEVGKGFAPVVTCLVVSTVVPAIGAGIIFAMVSAGILPAVSPLVAP